MFFIGSVRRILFIRGSHSWNAYVRDVTAWMEVHCPLLVTSTKR